MAQKSLPEEFAVDRSSSIDDRWVNRLLGVLEVRIAAIDAKRVEFEEGAAFLREHGLATIAATLAPAITEMQTLLGEVSTLYEELFEVGITTDTVLETEDRVYVTPALRDKLTNLGIADVTGLASALGGLSPTEHGHSISAITGLTTALQDKIASSRQLATEAPLTGGGDLSQNRTLGIQKASSIEAVAGADDVKLMTAAKVAAAIAAQAPAGAWQYIGEWNGNSTSAVSFTDLGDYQSLLLVFRAIGLTSGEDVQLLLSTNNGSSYAAGTFDLVDLDELGGDIDGGTILLLDIGLADRRTVGVANFPGHTEVFRSSSAQAHNAILLRGDVGSIVGDYLYLYGLPK